MHDCYGVYILINCFFSLLLVVTITLEALTSSVVEGATNAVILIKASGVRERSITVT